MLNYYLQRDGTDTKRNQSAPDGVQIAEAAKIIGNFTVVLQNGSRVESAWNFADAELARLIRIVDGA